MALALLATSKSKPQGSVKPASKQKPARAPQSADSLPLATCQSAIVQRKCACGGASGVSGQCEECSKQPSSLQAKLTVNAPGDIYEQQADRIADQALATPAHRAVSGTPPPIQRVSGQANEQTAAAPASVDQALASPGRPLAPALRQDLERRLGYDFSRVRVHSGALAERSAQDVQAHAYTVGHDIVFGKGYSPHTPAGQRLLTHELVHTLQQSASVQRVVQRQSSLDIALRSPGVTAQLLGAETLDGFDLNSPTLKAKHANQLLILAKRLKQLLRDHPLGTVEITGHTDATGEEAFNHQLGQDRADAVAAFLRRSAVPAIALLAQSAGERALRVPTQRPEPRNRRVEIRFLPELPTAPASTPQPGATETPKHPARVPRPENLCAEHPEICDTITTKPEAMPSCSPSNCSAVSGDRFDKQPPDLQLVLAKSFGANAAAWFEQLDAERRLALTQIFNRLCGYGLWCHVRLVLKIDPAEPPVLLADRIFQPPGLTPSVYFISPSGDALIDALMATGRFCMAYGTGASQHPGQTTLREISGSDSLHISVGPGNQVDAHVDKFSPVPEHPDGGFCSNAPSGAAIGHIGREVVPEKVRKWVQQHTEWLKLGPLPIVRETLRKLTTGVQVLPDFTVRPDIPQPEPAGTQQERAPPPIIGITWRGPRGKPPQPLALREEKPLSSDMAALPQEVVESIRPALEEQVSPQALLPSPVRALLTQARAAADKAGPGEETALRAARAAAEQTAAGYTDAHDIAFELAMRMEQARRLDRTWVKLDLERFGSYGGLDGASRKALLGEIRRIALILRKRLPEGAARVTTLVIIFGAGNLAVREEIRLPGWVAPEKGLFD